MEPWCVMISQRSDCKLEINNPFAHREQCAQDQIPRRNRQLFALARSSGEVYDLLKKGRVIHIVRGLRFEFYVGEI